MSDDRLPRDDSWEAWFSWWLDGMFQWQTWIPTAIILAAMFGLIWLQTR